MGWWAVWCLATLISYDRLPFFPAFGLCIATAMALINELAVKPVCKLMLPNIISARPPEAVCMHAGMPSGHVLNTYSLMVWAMLESAMGTIVHLEWIFSI